MQHAGTVRITSTPATSPSPTPSVERVARQGAALVRKGALRQSVLALATVQIGHVLHPAHSASSFASGWAWAWDQEISTGWDGFHHPL